MIGPTMEERRLTYQNSTKIELIRVVKEADKTIDELEIEIAGQTDHIENLMEQLEEAQRRNTIHELDYRTVVNNRKADKQVAKGYKEAVKDIVAVMHEH